MPIELWETRELYQLTRDDRLDPIPSYFLDTFFTQSYYSDDEKIRFAKLPNATRALAPYVLPTEQGKPVFRRKGESITEFTPPYVKPKDVVRAADAMNVLPSEVFNNGGQRPSLAERFDRRVVEIAEFHRRTIYMREAWNAARAILDGKVLLQYESQVGTPNPAVELNFGRDANLTITKNSGYWNDPTTPILSDLEEWMSRQYLATQGGSAAMLIVGAKVAPLFRGNNQVKDMLDTRYRGGDDVQVSRGIMRTERPMKYIGKLDSGLEVWSYKDQVENDNGDMIDIMDERDIALIAPGATGVRAHGAIMNDKAIAAGMSNVDIFPSMWTNDDPSATYLMHESAKLPIPLYPNRTLRARVLA